LEAAINLLPNRRISVSPSQTWRLHFCMV